MTVKNLICALFPEFKVRYKISNKERDLTRGKPGLKVEQKFFEGRLPQQMRSLDIPTSIVVVRENNSSINVEGRVFSHG